MATLVPHRQHSFMSPATWHARQGKQNIPQQPGRGRSTALAEALPACLEPPEQLGEPGCQTAQWHHQAKQQGQGKCVQGTHRHHSRSSSPSGLSATCISRLETWPRRIVAGSSQRLGGQPFLSLLKETGNGIVSEKTVVGLNLQPNWWLPPFSRPPFAQLPSCRWR